MGSELIHLLEQEAKAEKDGALAEARRRAEEILAAARKDAEEIAAESRRRVNAARAQIQARGVSTASLRAAALVLEAKDKAIQAVFARATEELTRASQDPARRRAMLRNLIAEAAEGLGDQRGTLEVPPGDAEAARAACQQLGLACEVKENSAVNGGIRLTTADRRVTVENTIASRLARTRSALISRVAETLWGA
jgi:vacuolar-type H+-ATPase subunit E/Vma4